MIAISTVIDAFLKLAAIGILVLLLLPEVASKLGIDMTVIALPTAAFIAALALLQPKVKKWAIPAYARRALEARAARTQAKNEER